MLKNFLKISWRSLMRARGYAMINITGLAVGMASSVMIFLWMRNELQFDRFYPHTDRLFQVYNKDIFNGEPATWGTTPVLLAPELKASYPDIQEAARYAPLSLLLSVKDKNVNIQGAFADPELVGMFGFGLISGVKNIGIDQILISRKLAENLFGTADAVGKTVEVEHKDIFTVAGVLADIPQNSQFADREYILPWSYFKKLGWASEQWESNNFITYVLLRENADQFDVAQKIKKVTARHLEGVIDNTSHREIFLHPAKKWHLYSKIEAGKLTDGGIATVRMFGIIAVFILLIACVNFVNLSTARSEGRFREIGVRKVAGAMRRSLIFQFISESVMLSLIAGIFAALIVGGLLPAFNNLTGTRLHPDLTSIPFWAGAIGFVILTGFLAGSYPAFFLSGLQTAKVLKGSMKTKHSPFSTRRGLVVLQFSFAIVLIISTLIIRQQLNHGQGRDSGYNRNNLLFTVLSGELENRAALVRQELISSGAAISTTRSLGPAASLNSRQWGLSWPGSADSDKNVEFDLFGTDQDFVRTTGVRMLEGRDIDIVRYPTDSTAIVLNEAAVKAMRLSNPVGTTVHYQNRDWQVVGVMKNFIFESPYDPVKPAILAGPGGMFPYQWLSIRLNPANSMEMNLRTAAAIFKKYNPSYPFDYSFADDTYKARFAREQLTGTLTGIFSVLSIFISCLGLFALAAFTAQQRTREIGVRKVLGATVAGIIRLLTLEFVQMACIAFLIAAPVGWYAMEKWLQDFNYRIAISPGVFILTALLIFSLVIVTVGFQAGKAALMNPVKSLKSE